MGAVGLFYEEARNFFTSNQYIATQMIELVTSASNTAASTMIRTVLNQASAGVGGGAAYLTGAQRMALTRPFSYSEYNLRPFDQLAGEAATTAGAIYLIVRIQTIPLFRQSAILTLRFGRTVDLCILLHSYLDRSVRLYQDEIDPRDRLVPDRLCQYRVLLLDLFALLVSPSSSF
jgi:hypothetical protein